MYISKQCIGDNMDNKHNKQELIYLQETTDWSHLEYKVPNHVYIVDKKTKWLVGYIPNGSSVEHFFKHPMKTFSKKERNFKDITKLMGW